MPYSGLRKRQGSNISRFWSSHTVCVCLTYAWLAVLHREDGGRARLLAARCDLATGRSLNIALGVWEKTYGPLRNAFSHEHGWTGRTDPAGATVEQPGHRAYIQPTRQQACRAPARIIPPRFDPGPDPTLMALVNEEKERVKAALESAVDEVAGAGLRGIRSVAAAVGGSPCEVAVVRTAMVWNRPRSFP